LQVIQATKKTIFLWQERQTVFVPTYAKYLHNL